jgi:McbB family protein
MNYSIKPFELIKHAQRVFIQSYDFAAAIENERLQNLLMELGAQNNNQITALELASLAEKYQLPSEELTTVLINTMGIIKPILRAKLSKLYINTDVPLISDILAQTFSSDYDVVVSTDHVYTQDEKVLVLFYRKQYTSDDFKAVYRALHKNTYLITAGVAHQILVIDNVFYQSSGLPTHFSNVNQLLGAVQSGMPISQNNWVVFYRELMQQGSEALPALKLNASQQAYVAYCLTKFTEQFTGLCSGTATMDKLNWFWHVDLKDGSILKDVAVHSPFSSQDMGLELITDAVAVEA